MEMRRDRFLAAFAAVTAVAVAGAAFALTAGASSLGTVVSTKHSKYGTILATASGQTLYLDVGDKPPHFACTGQCLTVWPPLKAKGTLRASGAAKAALLGTASGPAGKVVTYNHHPLYTFQSDTGRATTGEGVAGFYVVNPNGNKVTKASTTTTSTSSSSTSTGYKY
jgi:predicted lipoprotein with Yx(FWY)xxD motif